jgi:hypothetical protein
VQEESHGGGRRRLLGRLLGLAACVLGPAGFAVMLAALASGPKIAPADASERGDPPPVRSAAPLATDATSPDTGGRRTTGLAMPARTVAGRDATAAALRAAPRAGGAAVRRAGGAKTPSVLVAAGSPGSRHEPSDSSGSIGPHPGAPDASLSTISAPTGPLSVGDGTAETGLALAMAAGLTAALAAVLSRSLRLRAGEIPWSSTLLT